jgi:hypothetical protein
VFGLKPISPVTASAMVHLNINTLVKEAKQLKTKKESLFQRKSMKTNRSVFSKREREAGRQRISSISGRGDSESSCRDIQ